MRKDNNLDLFSGEELKRIGIAEVISHTKLSWYFAMFAAAEKLLAEGKTFTAEDLTDIVGTPPNHWNTTGAVMHAIASKLKLRAVGRAKARRASCHARKMDVWGR